MSHDSLLDRYGPFIAASVIAAYGVPADHCFQQKDVKHYLEFFTNWFNFTEKHLTLRINNTQISRYLKKLVESGLAREIRVENSHPKYSLTKVGLVELISRLVKEPYYSRKEYFYFVFFIVTTYGRTLKKFVREDSSNFPWRLQVEVDELLDERGLVDRQVIYVERAIERLKERIEVNVSISHSFKKTDKDRLKQLEDFQKLLPRGTKLEKYIPELSSLEDNTRHLAWELATGLPRRNQKIFKPALRELELHLDELKSLAFNS